MAKKQGKWLVFELEGERLVGSFDTKKDAVACAEGHLELTGRATFYRQATAAEEQGPKYKAGDVIPCPEGWPIDRFEIKGMRAGQYVVQRFWRNGTDEETDYSPAWMDGHPELAAEQQDDSDKRVDEVLRAARIAGYSDAAVDRIACELRHEEPATPEDTITADVNELSGWLDACLDGIGRSDVHSLEWLRDFQNSKSPAAPDPETVVARVESWMKYGIDSPEIAADLRRWMDGTSGVEAGLLKGAGE